MRIEVRMALMRPLKGNQMYISVEEREILTLRDILPAPPGLHVLFVAKTPALPSVKAGHYFQGQHGTNFWSSLKKYGLLKATTAFEDDSLLEHGYGLTDIVKVPRAFKKEPSLQEYMDGLPRILELIRTHRPEVVVFVYKGVLDKITRLQFGSKQKAVYGFNKDLEYDFGAKVFAFPLPGVGPCTTAQIRRSMQDLRDCLKACRKKNDPLLALRASGKELWADEHADEYVKRLREGWE
jgi:mismatch-specific thymine-DNA glycosylase